MQQIVDGLQYLHANNILHRDMKLPNLLVTADMRVKIADFGLATQLSRPDEPHMTMCGTPNYISPEVAMRTAHGQPADVWGLGIMMYTLLVGRPPFDTDGVASTLKRVCQAELLLPSHMSPEARDLLDRLLQKDQQRRIGLADVLCHPFMVKHATTASARAPLAVGAHYDSGVMTMSTTPSTISSAAPALAAAAAVQRFPLPIVEECDLMEYDLPPPRQQSVDAGFAEPLTYGSSSNLNPFLASTSKGVERSVLGSYDGRQHSVYGDAGIGNRFAMPASGQQENIQPNRQTVQQQQPVAAIDVAQLNAERLLPTRYETKKAILSIDATGRVLVELQRNGKIGKSHRTEICRISRDGARIEIYQPDPGRGQDAPVDQHRIEHFAYPHLPSKHWKKYTYAARFVQLVRAKTPKVTYYSRLAKCQLMETLVDFEMYFYAGDERFTRSPTDGVRFTSARGAVTEERDFGVRLDGPSTQQREHLQHCWQHCVQLERALREMQCEGEVFPNTVGRRPVTVPQVIGAKAMEQCASVSSPRMMPNVSARFGEPNATRLSDYVPSFQMQSFAMSISSSTSTSTNHNHNHHHSKPSPFAAASTPSGRILIPGIGIAAKSALGVLEVQYNDDTQLTVLPKEQGGGFVFRRSVSDAASVPMRYTISDELPELVRVRLEQIPMVLKHMAAQERQAAPAQAVAGGAHIAATSTPVTTRKLGSMRFCR